MILVLAKLKLHLLRLLPGRSLPKLKVHFVTYKSFYYVLSPIVILILIIRSVGLSYAEAVIDLIESIYDRKDISSGTS